MTRVHVCVAIYPIKMIIRAIYKVNISETLTRPTGLCGVTSGALSRTICPSKGFSMPHLETLGQQYLS